MRDRERSSVLVLGGGFAGLYAALAAARVGDGEIEVALLSREPWLTVRPRLYEADPASLKADLRPALAAVGVRFIEGEARGLDLDAGIVDLAFGDPLTFDRLVVATGSVMARPALPGAEAAWSIDQRAEAEAFDARLRAIAAGPAATVIVVGAGFTGIELALELRDRLAVHGGEAAGEAARIVLVDRAAVVGDALGAGPRPAIEAALREARVETRLGGEIAELGERHVTLAGGERIVADAVVLCTGLIAAPFNAVVPGAHAADGRLIVDADLRVAESPHIFAAGDAARAATVPGEAAPATLFSCQHALRTGRVAGENAGRDLSGLAPVPYRQQRYVTCLDLGRAGAILTQGWARAPHLTGAEAKAMKRRINREIIYPPSGDRAAVLAASAIEEI